jgi:hypothetical protein
MDGLLVGEDVFSERRDDGRTDPHTDQVDHEQVQSSGLGTHVIGHHLLNRSGGDAEGHTHEKHEGDQECCCQASRVRERKK